MYTCMYIYIYIYICMYVHTYICIIISYIYIYTYRGPSGPSCPAARRAGRGRASGAPWRGAGRPLCNYYYVFMAINYYCYC